MKIVLHITLLLVALCSSAGDVTYKKALEIAAAAMHSDSRDITLINNNMTRASDGMRYYAFNRTDDKGFIIVAGDDRLPAVFAYSDNTSLPADRSDLPPGLKDILLMYEQVVDGVRSGTFDIDAALQSTTAHASAVKPLVSSKWGQGEPFSNLCPKGCATGCVATAAAQLMRYHKWPESGTGTVSTIYNGTSLSLDLAQSTYDWEAMADTKEENLADSKAAEAVARICYDFGVAAQMEYGPESGAADVDAVKALFDNFGYHAGDMRFLHRDCYDSDVWMDMVKTELENGRPLYYAAGTETAAPGTYAGHAFIIDGYDEQGMVHVNWGWNGASDGYYDIALLNPMSLKFTINQTMIAGLRPNKESEASTYKPIIVMDGPLETNTSGVNYNSSSGSGEFGIPNPVLANYNPNNYNGYATISLYKDNGELVSEDIKSGKMFSAVLSLQPNYYFIPNSTTISCKLPGKLAQGDYYLKLVTKRTDDTSWTLPDVIGGQQNNYIHVNLAGKKVTFDNKPTAIENIKADGNAAMTEFYNISGQRISRPASGNIVIVKQGKKMKKMIVR